jgi:hypothetical protein
MYPNFINNSCRGHCPIAKFYKTCQFGRPMVIKIPIGKVKKIGLAFKIALPSI